MITPQTNIRLLNVPFDPGQKNVLDFESVNAQRTYFTSTLTAIATFSDCTYQRQNSAIRVAARIDNLWAVNYCAYQNLDNPGKWFYAFVRKLTFIADEVTELELESDPFQTWMFNYTILPSFIEREHEALT